MKKALVLFLMILAAVSLCACSERKQPTQNDTAQTAVYASENRSEKTYNYTAAGLQQTADTIVVSEADEVSIEGNITLFTLLLYLFYKIF